MWRTVDYKGNEQVWYEEELVNAIEQIVKDTLWNDRVIFIENMQRIYDLIQSYRYRKGAKNGTRNFD